MLLYEPFIMQITRGKAKLISYAYIILFRLTEIAVVTDVVLEAGVGAEVAAGVPVMDSDPEAAVEEEVVEDLVAVDLAVVVAVEIIPVLISENQNGI